MNDRVEIAKFVERAEKLLQKGKPADALELYLQVLAINKENDTVRQMAADLSLSLNRTPDAVRLLGELLDRQITAADAPRASLTYKKLARFINPNWEQKVRFAQLLETTNRKLAIETYDHALEELIHQGRKVEALDVLQLVLSLDPSQKNIMRKAELCAATGDHRASADAYFKLARLAQESRTDAAQWLEKAYAENPADENIALEYARSLIAQQQVGAAIFILEPIIQGGKASTEFRDAYAKALLSANRLSEAEPALWTLFEEDPTRAPEIAKLIEAYLTAVQDADAIRLARKMEAFQRRKGDRRAFITMMQEIVARHRATPDLLEFMSELFNSSNRETDYSQTLLKLFDLHYGIGNFMKAADCLDKAAEVDAYEPGHQKRLESLRGKIDDNRFMVISSRFTSMAPVAPTRNEERTLGSGTLQDLMLQAEILVQYGMRAKAVERLQRIQELFPHEEDRNADLRALYNTAGVMPEYGPAASTPSPVQVSVAAAPVPAPPVNNEPDVSQFTRVAEITRKLYKQNNADAVLSTSVNEIGALWRVGRCVAATRKPGLAPSAIREYAGDGCAPGSGSALARVVIAVHELAVAKGTLTLNEVQSASELSSVKDALAELQISSLLAIPLTEGPDHVGLLMLTQQTPRIWGASDVMVLKTIAEQIVIALNNVGLRRLVKNLSVTDERSGLLKRSSYLDLLMAETRRALQQGTPLTLLLMGAGDRAALVRDSGEAAVEAAMQQIGQIIAGNIRQNDLAFRYATTTIAIVLGETAEKESMMAVDKLRRLLAGVKIADKTPVSFTAGLAEAVVRQPYDPVDIVTEVINRSEMALTAAAQAPNKTAVLPAALTSAAAAS
jgi:tetratricopeptide (TPR) repeat protein/GGDEF domain-containing protein